MIQHDNLEPSVGSSNLLTQDRENLPDRDHVLISPGDDVAVAFDVRDSSSRKVDLAWLVVD